MPAEWEPHEATWLAWPHNREDWPGKFDPIPWVFAEIIRHLSAGERVEVLVADDAAEKKARRVLSRAHADSPNVRFHHVATDRIWMRDSGPCFLTRTQDGTTEAAAVRWKFNGWAKYANHAHDTRVAEAVAKRTQMPLFRPKGPGAADVVLEGGAIDVNGRGVLLTTEECLLSEIQQRNPAMSREDYENTFQHFLGIEKVVWLHRGIVGDDTHGHVDDLARFVNEDTIVTVVEDNKADENHEILAENLAILKSARDAHGRPFRVVTLPMPEPIWFDGLRLPASYANFYIGNSVVLVPTFNDVQDKVALTTLQSLFPSRKVIGIHCSDFVLGLGTLHCMTQQQPIGTPAILS